MIDVLLRALRHPVDYSTLLRSHTLTFREHTYEHGAVHSFIFEPTEPLSWKAGQHAIFTLPHGVKTGKSWRPFSVASAPHEGVIRIGTTIPEPHSDFKERFLQLKAGDTIHMYGPYGEFHLRPNIKRVIGVAGGIGITPFRSLIADATHRKLPIPITLIYSARDIYTYKEEFDGYSAANPHFTIEYVHDANQVNLALTEAIDRHKNNAHYFISGSPGMISAIQKTCRTQGVHKIINDPFKGY